MTLHQKLTWEEDVYENDDEENGKLIDFKEHPVTLDETTLLRSWEIARYGHPRKTGEVCLYHLDEGQEDYYLEARIEGEPIFSIAAYLDQWGTYYRVKSGGEHFKPDEDGVSIYAQEWGTSSFIRTLAVALQAMVDKCEPRAGTYDGTDVRETTPVDTVDDPNNPDATQSRTFMGEFLGHVTPQADALDSDAGEENPT